MSRWPLLLLLPLVFPACAGMNVKRDYDTAANFQALKTYAWQAPPGGQPDNSLMEARVAKAVDAALAEKGYRKTASGDMDFLVTYRYDVMREAGEGNVHTGVGLGGGSGGLFGGISLGMGSRAQDSEYETLAIDINNPSTRALMWRGTTQQRLPDQSDPGKTTARINAEVKAILSKFPPK